MKESMLTLDDIKKDKSLHILKYKFENEKLYTSPHGYFFIEYLDQEDFTAEQRPDDVVDSQEELEIYIKNKLESNEQRFLNQYGLVKKYLPDRSIKVLDVGCGGGKFLSLIEKSNDLYGIELNPARLIFATKKHDLNVLPYPIESEFWDEHKNSFDLIVLWDVIEHVNYPSRTLKRVAELLNAGGYLMIDTPCRDSTFFKLGQFSYNMTFGKVPLTLKATCRSTPFAHKQIFTLAELKRETNHAGLQVVEMKRFFELSFPIEHYTDMIFKQKSFSAVLTPIVKLVLKLCCIKNKMYMVARKEQ